MQRKQSRSARFAASETLLQIYNTRCSVKVLLDKAANRYELAPKDRNLAMQLVYGVLRCRQSLDRILTTLSRTPLGKLDPFIHQVLAVGLYQLFYLERIPESAAVNEAVKACKQARLPKRLHGFVNGILRQAVRQRQQLAAEITNDGDGSPIFNHPQWLVERWQEEFGVEEATRICLSNNREPELVLRVNRSLISRDECAILFQQAGIPCRFGSYSEDALVLTDFHGQVNTLAGYDQGFFQVQDEAPQLATLLLGPFRRNGRYLDGCAGLGGKTSHLLQFAREFKLQIHAVEPDPQRLRKLRENITRLLPDQNVITHGGSLQQLASAGLPRFDGILIDAPCSGTGVTGRHPDIRWNRRLEDLHRYQRMQLDLLELAPTLLEPRGVLVYATCSLEPEENTEVVTTFLETHPDFILTDCSDYLPRSAQSLVTDRVFAPRPSALIDGFFGARMERI